MKSLSVLIADDEDIISLLVQRCMVEEGHEAISVANAVEAKAELARRTFDLVITDILMPEGDGLDLITELRCSQPDARILAISGGGRIIQGDDCLRMARGMGAHAAIMKPFDRAQLLAGMEEAMK